jgi:uncharacterized membrane protein YhaH (DUF805 family)
MPHWVPPLAAAAFAVLLLNIALMVQRVRERSKSWPAQFLRDLRDWDGRLATTTTNASIPNDARRCGE